jgi:hypothetical protein
MTLATAARPLQEQTVIEFGTENEGRKAVAARFLGEVSNWIIKP